jgi:tetratricopeptide (TPR) repeat protein
MILMKRTGFVFFLILLMAGTVSAQLNINHYIRVGQTRIAIGNYVGAIEYFNIVIKFKPHLPEPYFYRAVAKHRLEDFRGAIDDYNQALYIKPFFPDAYMNRGMAYHELRDFDNAIKDYDRTLEMDPKNEGAYNNRGIAKISLKNVEGAIEDYNKALEVNPTSTNALMNRSNAKIIQADIQGAIQDLNSVIIIRPHFAGAYLNRGLARFELNDFASALRDYDQAIRFEPENALAYNNRGIVKHKLEDYAGAIMDYDMAIRLDPTMANAYFNRAMARELLKRPGFDADYQIAADLNPQYDLSRFSVNAEQLAQQSSQQQQQQQQQQTQAQNQTQNTGSQNTTSGNNQQSTDNQNKTEVDPVKEREEELRRRRRLNVIATDSRNLPKTDEDPDDGRVQNKNIIIDLQPIFLISAFERNSVDYERLQYYSVSIESLNRVNNYNPFLTITNKTNVGYKQIFENFVLFFNEKINIAENGHNYLNRGIFHLLTGNYNQSLNDLNKSIGMTSDEALAYFTRGNCRFKMIEHIESLPDFTNQLTIALESARLQQPAEPGMTKMISDYDDILSDYDKTLEMKPGFFFGYYNKAFINLRLNKYELALADLTKAIELEPEFAEAFYNRGLTKIFLDDIEGGALDLSKAGELGLIEAYSVIKRYCNF